MEVNVNRLDVCLSVYFVDVYKMQFGKEETNSLASQLLMKCDCLIAAYLQIMNGIEGKRLSICTSLLTILLCV